MTTQFKTQQVNYQMFHFRWYISKEIGVLWIGNAVLQHLIEFSSYTKSVSAVCWQHLTDCEEPAAHVKQETASHMVRRTVSQMTCCHLRRIISFLLGGEVIYLKVKGKFPWARIEVGCASES